MKALALISIGVNTVDLAAAAAFYTDALGFDRTSASEDADATLASLLGARGVRRQTLRRGGQCLELTQFDPPGAPNAPHGRSDDLVFQHCALATDDIGAAYARLRRHRFTPISRDGPQALPGGIIAFKFRDPDGHPLELIQFPMPDPATRGGIDHSAISVSDADASIGFYAELLRLAVSARQTNAGPSQDALDDLDGAIVDVIGLTPAAPAPHVELLAYRASRGVPPARMRPSDIAATRLVFATDASLEGARAALVHDPDGHALMLLAGP